MAGGPTSGLSEPLQLHGPVLPLDRTGLLREAPEVARSLLGAVLVRQLDGQEVVARIVETEAYREGDPASHSYRGRTPRNQSMFGGPGRAYVYRCYGIHWMLNLACEPAGRGAAVLLRAAVVLTGAEPVRARRSTARGDQPLLGGPGTLAAGLGIDGSLHDGLDLLDASGTLWCGTDGWRPPDAAVEVTRRIGISRAQQLPWRFLIPASSM